MTVLETACQLFVSQLGDEVNLDSDSVTGALGGLLGDGENIDIGNLISQFGGEGIGDMLSSWLGDGGNLQLDIEQLSSVFGEGALADFAANLGIDQGLASQALADTLPALIDQYSSGGNLLEAAGGLGGILGAVGKLFR